jgi:hypothetical protein
VRVLVHTELRRRHTGLQDAIDGNVPAVDGQAPQRARELVNRQPGVDQRTEDHVPRRPRETVEIENLHRLASSLKLKNVLLPRMM